MPFMAAVTAAPFRIEWPENPSVGIPTWRSRSWSFVRKNCFEKGKPKGREKEDGWANVDKSCKEVWEHELDIMDWKEKGQDEFVYPAGKGRFWKLGG